MHPGAPSKRKQQARVGNQAGKLAGGNWGDVCMDLLRITKRVEQALPQARFTRNRRVRKQAHSRGAVGRGGACAGNPAWLRCPKAILHIHV